MGGIYAGKCNPTLVAYVHNLNASLVKDVVLVTSSASTRQRCQKEIRDILEKKGMVVVGEISCPGSFLFVRMGHPNEKDIRYIVNEAKSFVNR